jgi:hypothetical protein
MPRRNVKKKTLPGGPHLSRDAGALFNKKPWVNAQGFIRASLTDDPG